MLIKGPKKFWGMTNTAALYVPASGGGGGPTPIASINFRNTSGFVTDGTNETYSLGEAFPTTRAGVTFGFDYAIPSSTADRSNTNDPRYAGAVIENGVGFTITLPASGVYKVNVVIGDPFGFSTTNQFTIYDNTTSLLASGALATTTDVYDINQTSYASFAAYLAGTTPMSLTFSSTTFKLILDGASNGSLTNITITR